MPELYGGPRSSQKEQNFYTLVYDSNRSKSVENLQCLAMTDDNMKSSSFSESLKNIPASSDNDINAGAKMSLCSKQADSTPATLQLEDADMNNNTSPLAINRQLGMGESSTHENVINKHCLVAAQKDKKLNFCENKKVEKVVTNRQKPRLTFSLPEKLSRLTSKNQRVDFTEVRNERGLYSTSHEFSPPVVSRKICCSIC